MTSESQLRASKKWREKNKEKCIQYNREYIKKYQKENKQKVNEKYKRYYEKHKEEINKRRQEKRILAKNEQKNNV